VCLWHCVPLFVCEFNLFSHSGEEPSQLHIGQQGVFVAGEHRTVLQDSTAAEEKFHVNDTALALRIFV